MCTWVVLCRFVHNDLYGKEGQGEKPNGKGVQSNAGTIMQEYDVLEKLNREVFGLWDEIRKLGTRQYWWIKPKDLVLTSSLGTGAFGLAHQAKLYGHSKVFVKAIDAAQCTPCDVMAAELGRLHRACHPSLVLLRGVSIHDGSSLCIVFEWVDGCCNLTAYAQASAFAAHLPSIGVSITMGLQYLHALRPPLLHQALKPDSILVRTSTHPPEAKMSDVGLAALLCERVRPKTADLHYMAPELANDSATPCTAAADVYAYGRVLQFIFAKSSEVLPASSSQRARSSAYGCAAHIAQVELCVNADAGGRPPMDAMLYYVSCRQRMTL